MKLQQIFSESMDDQSVLINNLNLLQYDQKELENFGLLKKNQKTSFQLLRFFLNILTDDKAENLFMLCYPASTSKDQIEFRNACMEIFKQLENNHQIPQNFVLSKSELDGYGPQHTYFFRQLSEFCLRHKMNSLYSSSKQSGFQLLKNRESSSLFQQKYPTFYNLDPQLVDEKKLDHCITGAYYQIKLQHEKFEKKCAQMMDLQKIKKAADSITSQFHDLRKKNILLKEKIKNIKPNKIIFSENRALDRIPQIDISRLAYEDLQKSYNNLIEQQTTEKLISYGEDQQQSQNLIDVEYITGQFKTNQIIELSQLYQKWNQKLLKLDEEVDQHQVQEISSSINQQLQQISEQSQEQLLQLDLLQKQLQKLV